MREQASSPNDERTVRVNLGKVESVDLYEIKDSELDLLEKGSLVSLDFTFAIFLFSTAFTSIAALATSDFKTQTLESIFLFVSIIGIIGGVYFIIRWWLSRTPLREVVLTIKNRIKPDTRQPSEAPELLLFKDFVERELKMREERRKDANIRSENNDTS